MSLSELSTAELIKHLCRGRQKIKEASAQGKPVSSWRTALANLEAELARRIPEGPAATFEREEICRLLDRDGWVLIWSTVLGDLIAFARDDQAAAQVPSCVIAYTREELSIVVGSDAETLRLIHEAKREGASIQGRSRQGQSHA